jgi:hypothetical protein
MAVCAAEGCRRWCPDILAFHSRMGFRMDQEWVCSTGCLEDVVRARLVQTLQPTDVMPEPLGPLKLGGLLVHYGMLKLQDLKQALSEQRRSGLPLGAQLRHLGLCSSEDVLRALATQSGVSYLQSLDLACLRRQPGRLSREAAQALRLVPFEAREPEQKVKVVCLAPVPRVAIHAMHELTGYTVEPFLVADELWPSVVAAYHEAQKVASSTVRSFVCDREAAVSHVVKSAARVRTLQLRRAHCHPYTWLRLEGAGLVEDLLVPDGHRVQEDSWEALPTSH